MPEATNDIVTIDEAMRYMKKDELDEDERGFIKYCLTTASTSIEQYLRKKVTRQPVTFVCNGTGTGALPLTPWPIIELIPCDGEFEDNQESGSVLNAILQRGAMGEGSWSPLLTDSSVISLDDQWENRGRIWLLGGAIFPGGFKNIRIRYVAGFEPMLGILTETVLDMVQAMYKRSPRGGGFFMTTSKSHGGGGGNTSVSATLNEDWWKERIKHLRSLTS